MGLWSTFEVVTFHTSLKTAAFTGAHHIHSLTHIEDIYLNDVPFGNFWILNPKLTQKTQGGPVETIALKMTQFTTRQAFGLGFLKPQLDCRVAILFG
jgi:hypothetical protein